MRCPGWTIIAPNHSIHYKIVLKAMLTNPSAPFEHNKDRIKDSGRTLI